MSKARRMADSLRLRDTQNVIDIREMTSSALVERTAYGNGTDIGPLIAAAGTALRSRSNTGRGLVRIPSGRFRVAAAIDDDAIAGIYFEGAGAQATQLYYDATDGDMWRFDGENTTAGWSGGGLARMRLILGAASLGGGTPRAINCKGLNVSGTWSEPDDFHLQNIYINAETAGTARWYQGLQFDGSDRASPPGIRGITIQDLQVFECSNLAIYLRSLIQATIENMGSYVGAGTGNDIHITGTGGVPSTQVSAINVACAGTLAIANISDLMIQAKCAGLSISGADQVWGFINNSGATAGSFGAGSSVLVI